MLNFLIFSLLFACSTVFFNFSQSLLRVKSSWSAINVTLVQDAVVIPSLPDDNDQLSAIAPCFDSEILERVVTGSLETNLSPFLSRERWQAEFLYSAYQMGQAYPQAVTLRFNATYYGEHVYSGSKNFQLVPGASYEQ
jgi:hypothetical protein